MLECVFLGPGARVHRRRDGRRHRRRRCRRRSTATPRDNWTSFKVKAGDVLSFDFLKTGRARLHRRLRRHRRAGGARQPLDLSARRARRLQGPAAPGRRRTAGRCRRSGKRGPRGRRKTCARMPGNAGRAARRPRPLLAPHHRGGAAATSSPTPGRSRRKPTASATASAAAGRSQFVPREQPFGAGSDPSNIVDACYPYGSIQVPGGTEPIVLHRDAVSGGGYFMVGTVDLGRHGPDRPAAAAYAGAVRQGHGRPGARGPQGPRCVDRAGADVIGKLRRRTARRLEASERVVVADLRRRLRARTKGLACRPLHGRALMRSARATLNAYGPQLVENIGSCVILDPRTPKACRERRGPNLNFARSAPVLFLDPQQGLTTRFARSSELSPRSDPALGLGSIEDDGVM